MNHMDMDIQSDDDVISFFEAERAQLERNPLWRAAWLSAKEQRHDRFEYDGVEWRV